MRKVNFNELFTDYDTRSGTDVFYLDKELKQPFTGIVEEYFNGKLSCEYEVENGYKKGKEKEFYDTGELRLESDVKNNIVDGIQKEFYENGRLKSISIVIRNVFIDTIFLDETGKVSGKKTIDKNHPSYFLVSRKIQEYRERYKIENELAH